MNAWPFIIAAYGLMTLGSLGLMLWSWLAMTRAEHALEDKRDR